MAKSVNFGGRTNNFYFMKTPLKNGKTKVTGASHEVEVGDELVLWGSNYKVLEMERRNCAGNYGEIDTKNLFFSAICEKIHIEVNR